MSSEPAEDVPLFNSPTFAAAAKDDTKFRLDDSVSNTFKACMYVIDVIFFLLSFLRWERFELWKTVRIAIRKP